MGNSLDSGVNAPFTENFRFTGPNVAISCDVVYDKENGQYHARGNRDTFHGVSNTAEGAALNCFTAWMTSNMGWFQPEKEERDPSDPAVEERTWYGL